MKKKTIIMAIILFLIIIIGITMKLYTQQETSPENLNKKNDTTQEENETQHEWTEQDDNMTDESSSPPLDIPKEFTKAIQKTIQFFAGKQKKIVAIGDSLTEGVGDETGQGGYVGILDRQLNHDKKIATFENLGKRGNRTKDLLKRIETPEIQKSLSNADIIIITIGANDLMQVVKENFMDITYDVFKKERVFYEERLNNIFVTLNTINPDASIYLIGFYNPFIQYFDHIKELDMIVDDWNVTSDEVARENQVTFIPMKDLFMSETVHLFAEDHFHPNGTGYQLMAERILNYLVVD